MADGSEQTVPGIVGPKHLLDLGNIWLSPRSANMVIRCHQNISNKQTHMPQILEQLDFPSETLYVPLDTILNMLPLLLPFLKRARAAVVFLLVEVLQSSSLSVNVHNLANHLFSLGFIPRQEDS